MEEKKERVKYHVYFNLKTEKDVIDFFESITRPMRSKLVVVALRMLKQWLESQPENFSFLLEKKIHQDVKQNSSAEILKDSSEVLDKKSKKITEEENIKDGDRPKERPPLYNHAEQANQRELKNHEKMKQTPNAVEEIDFSKIFRF